MLKSTRFRTSLVDEKSDDSSSRTLSADEKSDDYGMNPFASDGEYDDDDGKHLFFQLQVYDFKKPNYQLHGNTKVGKNVF